MHPRVAAALRWAPLAVGAAFVAWRFWNLEDASFINDEPKYLQMAQDQLRSGTWATNSGVGSQGFVYGPAQIWFYRVVQGLFGPLPLTAIAANCVATTASQVGLVLAMSNRKQWTAPGVGLAILGSSPFLFWWSRTAWDFFPYFVAYLAAAIMVRSPALGWKQCLGLGVLVGLGLDSHPMIAYFALPVGMLVLFEHRKRPLLAVGMGALTAGVAALVAAPWFFALKAAGGAPSTGLQFPTFERWTRVLFEPVRMLTSHKVDYLFNESWKELEAGQPLVASLQAATGLTLAVLALATLAGLYFAARGAHAGRRRTAQFALALLVFYPVMLAASSVTLQVHHSWPLMWIPIFGCVVAVEEVAERFPRHAPAAVALLLAVAAYHFAFIQQWTQFVHREGGNRTLVLNSTLGEQTRAIAQVCQQPERTIFLENYTHVLPGSLAYIHATTPACAGKALQFCPPGRCPPTTPESRTLLLGYARQQGAALAVAAR